jgi:hypothetical protein
VFSAALRLCLSLIANLSISIQVDCRIRRIPCATPYP